MELQDGNIPRFRPCVIWPWQSHRGTRLSQLIYKFVTKGHVRAICIAPTRTIMFCLWTGVYSLNESPNVTPISPRHPTITRCHYYNIPSYDLSTTAFCFYLATVANWHPNASLRENYPCRVVGIRIGDIALPHKVATECRPRSKFIIRLYA